MNLHRHEWESEIAVTEIVDAHDRGTGEVQIEVRVSCRTCSARVKIGEACRVSPDGLMIQIDGTVLDVQRLPS